MAYETWDEWTEWSEGLFLAQAGAYESTSYTQYFTMILAIVGVALLGGYAS